MVDQLGSGLGGGRHQITSGLRRRWKKTFKVNGHLIGDVVENRSNDVLMFGKGVQKELIEMIKKILR